MKYEIFSPDFRYYCEIILIIYLRRGEYDRFYGILGEGGILFFSENHREWVIKNTGQSTIQSLIFGKLSPSKKKRQ